MAYVLKEVSNQGVDWPYAISKDELIKRITEFADEYYVESEGIDRIIGILFHGVG